MDECIHTTYLPFEPKILLSDKPQFCLTSRHCPSHLPSAHTLLLTFSIGLSGPALSGVSGVGENVKIGNNVVRTPQTGLPCTC